MGTLIAEAEVNRAHLESSAGILGQQQQLEEAARKQVQSPAALPTRLFAVTGFVSLLIHTDQSQISLGFGHCGAFSLIGSSH